MFPQAPLRSRTVGFPESGSDLGFAMQVFPSLRRIKCGLTYTPPDHGLPHTPSSYQWLLLDDQFTIAEAAKYPEFLRLTTGITVLSEPCLA